jgi:hypothetical protein
MMVFSSPTEGVLPILRAIPRIHDRLELSGEALRNKLRLLNAILAFGLNIPVGDTPSASVSDEVKDEVASKHAGMVVDSVRGLLTLPDDGMHFKYVVGGSLEVRPTLQILGLANLETSEKAAFLTS